MNLTNRRLLTALEQFKERNPKGVPQSIEDSIDALSQALTEGTAGQPSPGMEAVAAVSGDMPERATTEDEGLSPGQRAAMYPNDE